MTGKFGQGIDRAGAAQSQVSRWAFVRHGLQSCCASDSVEGCCGVGADVDWLHAAASAMGFMAVARTPWAGAVLTWRTLTGRRLRWTVPTASHVPRKDSSGARRDEWSSVKTVKEHADALRCAV